MYVVNKRYRSEIFDSVLGEQALQLIVALVSELKQNLLSQGIPSDCVTSHCQALGPGDCNVIVQVPGIV